MTNRENGIFPFWLSPFFLEQRKGLLFFGGYLYLESMLLKSNIRTAFAVHLAYALEVELLSGHGIGFPPRNGRLAHRTLKVIPLGDGQ